LDDGLVAGRLHDGPDVPRIRPNPFHLGRGVALGLEVLPGQLLLAQHGGMILPVRQGAGHLGLGLLPVMLGHHPPILLRRDGDCVRLSEGGAVLGVCSDWRYTEGEIELHSGDRLLLFTDGVSEAMDADGEEFGERRLIEMMAGRPGLDPEQLQSIIMHSVTEFCGGGLQDDATLISLSIDAQSA